MTEPADASRNSEHTSCNEAARLEERERIRQEYLDAADPDKPFYMDACHQCLLNMADALRRAPAGDVPFTEKGKAAAHERRDIGPSPSRVNPAGDAGHPRNQSMIERGWQPGDPV